MSHKGSVVVKIAFTIAETTMANTAERVGQ